MICLPDSCFIFLTTVLLDVDSLDNDDLAVRTEEVAAGEGDITTLGSDVDDDA
jgi:hypothetical protein